MFVGKCVLMLAKGSPETSSVMNVHDNETPTNAINGSTRLSFDIPVTFVAFELNEAI
jgi:hypothetical protein